MLWPLLGILLPASTVQAQAVSDQDRFKFFNFCRPIQLAVADLSSDARAIGLTEEGIQIAVESRLARRPHYQVHFTPTAASWLNQVERWFAELTRKQLRRGVHTSTRQLEADIRAFIDTHNANPKPFIWTQSADAILASIKRFCHRVE